MDHDHLPALLALLYGAPIALIALSLLQAAAKRGSAAAASAMARIELAGRRTQAVALGLFVAGIIHLGLVPGHIDEPLLAGSFVVAGVAMVALAGASLTTVWWRAPAALVVVSTLCAYVVTRLAGAEGVDVLGVVTAAIELVGLVLIASLRTDRRSQTAG